MQQLGASPAEGTNGTSQDPIMEPLLPTLPCLGMGDCATNMPAGPEQGGASQHLGMLASSPHPLNSVIAGATKLVDNTAKG